MDKPSGQRHEWGRKHWVGVGDMQNDGKREGQEAEEG